MTDEQHESRVREQMILLSIRKNVCPFGMVEPGNDLSTCPSGFPGCGCMDILVSTMGEEK